MRRQVFRRVAGGGGRKGEALTQRGDVQIVMGKSKTECVGNPLRGTAVYTHAGDLGQAITKKIAQALYFNRLLFKHFCRQGKSRAHSGDLMRRQRPGAQAAFVPSPVNLGENTLLRTRADIQGANAFGPVDLVCRERHQIHRELAEVDRQLASALCSVDMQQRPVPTYAPADFGDVVDGTQLVIDQHQRDQKGIVTQGCTDCIGTDQTLAVRCQPGDIDALFLKLTSSVEGSLVLDQAGDDMTRSASGGGLPLGTFLSHPLECQIAGLGRAGSPDDLRGLRTHQMRNLLTGKFHCKAGLLAERMGAGGRVAEIA